MANLPAGFVLDAPDSSGLPPGFQLDAPQQTEQKTGQRGRPILEQRSALPEEEIFAGLPDDVISVIKQKSVGGRSNQFQPAVARKLADFERLRIENPYLAEDIENPQDTLQVQIPFTDIRGDTGIPLPGAASNFLRGSGKGLTDLGRAVGGAESSPEQRARDSALTKNSGAAAFGEVVGQTAPFVAAGGPLTGLAKTAGQRALVGGGLSAIESGAITKGRGGSAKETAIATALGAGIGAAAPLAPAAISSLRGKLKQSVSSGANLLAEPTSREVSKAVAKAAPTPEKLRAASKEIYDNLRDSGVAVSDKSFDSLISSAKIGAKRTGYRETAASIKDMPAVKNIFDRMDEVKQGVIDFDEIEAIRKAAQNSGAVASRAGDNAQAAALASIVDDIDGYLLRIDGKDFTSKMPGFNIGKEASTARKLWGRARKAELMDEAVEKAKSQASGLENGIRIQFKQIINNKKQSRFFSPEEISAMKAVERGTTTANTLRRLGKMGWGEGKQNTVLNALVGGGVGGAGLTALAGGSGLASGASLLLFPIGGTISGKFARRLTEKSAAMANQLVRAGPDASKMARIYLRNTPVAERSVDDLAAILMRPELNLAVMKKGLSADIARAAKLIDGLPEKNIALVNSAISKALKDRLTQQAAVVAPLAALPAAAAATEE